MVLKKVAPYGEWDSPISIDDVTAGSKAVSSPRGDVRTGRVFYLEALPSGANTIVEVVSTPGRGAGAKAYTHELKHVLPASSSVSTTVYEYGGGAYEVLPASSPGQHQRIIFSDAKDQNALKLLDVDTGSVRTLVSGKGWLRYADFGPHPHPHPGAEGEEGGDWVLAIEEDHTHPSPEDVKNRVVAINIRTDAVIRLLHTADFYSNPRFSPDGRWISWREWEHPEMPWTKSRLCLARVEPENVKNDRLGLGCVENVAGGYTGECVGESAWGLDGALYFSHEDGVGDWRQLWRIRPENIPLEGIAEQGGLDKDIVRLEGLEEVEIGSCSMVMDFRTFCFLSTESLVLSYTKYASYSTVHVDLGTLKVTPLDVPLIDMGGDSIAAVSATSFLVLGSGTTRPKGVYHFALADRLAVSMTKVATESSKSWPPKTFSQPQHIQLVSKHSPQRPVHGFYWPPNNPSFTGPEDALPPLLVNPHGGPTGHTGAGLKVGGIGGGNVPFWTSRGFAYFAINYTGSSGHGRSYRQRLDTQWGILDRDDVPECVEYLCSQGLADRDRVGIHGGSAGGYNVLQSLVWHPDTFAAGVCYCGVSDVKKLAQGTHKLESHYLEGLLFEPGMSVKQREERMYERSPVWHAERIRSPLLLCHGDEDTVVPIAQSYEIERRIRERGGTVEMVVAPGDGHMFKMRESVRLVMEKEVKWFMKYLVGK